MAVEFFPFSVSVQGASHIRRENTEQGRKFPCQDRSHSAECKADNIHKIPYYITCVCDGHGGAAYFRSGTGASFAISAMMDSVPVFSDLIFKCDSVEQATPILKQLAEKILDLWNKKVDLALVDEPITEEEWNFLEADDKKAFDSYKAAEQGGAELRSIYGCTALCFVASKEKWFALQIGDGDIVIEKNGKFSKPVPEDKSLFLNQTTSICDSNAANEFRFAFGEGIPTAVLCSTDGLANCFKDDEGLFNFHSKLTWLFRDWDGYKEENESDENSERSLFKRLSQSISMPDLEPRAERAVQEIKNSLPDLSKRGSGDDISVAGYVGIDPLKVKQHLKAAKSLQNGLELWQKKKYDKAIDEFENAAKNGYPQGWTYLGKSYSVLLKNAKNENDQTKLRNLTIDAFSNAVAQGEKNVVEILARLLFARGKELQANSLHKDAFVDFEKSANYGNAAAQYALSLYYGRPQDYDGCEVKQNFQRAIEWTIKAANQGFADAECKLGKCYKDGRGVQKNAELSLEWYQKAAEHGSEEAKTYLSQGEQPLVKEEGVPQPPPQVVPDLQRSIHEQASGMLNSVKKNSNLKAVALNIKLIIAFVVLTVVVGVACAICSKTKRSPEKLCVLGYDYYYGNNGRAKNYEKAFHYWKKSANKGNPEAQYNLGYCYYKGLGVAGNREKPFEWWTKSAEQNNASAQYNLACICFVYKEEDKALEWWQKAAEQGHAKSMYQVGRYYYFGLGGVRVDYEEAVRWWTMSANQDNKLACYGLALCYKKGNGVPEDIGKAFYWESRFYEIEKDELRAITEDVSSFDSNNLKSKQTEFELNILDSKSMENMENEVWKERDNFYLYYLL